jgi:hypothetical protein
VVQRRKPKSASDTNLWISGRKIGWNFPNP